MVVDNAVIMDSAHRLTRKGVKRRLLHWKLCFLGPFDVLVSTSPQRLTTLFPLIVKIYSSSANITHLRVALCVLSLNSD